MFEQKFQYGTPIAAKPRNIVAEGFNNALTANQILLGEQMKINFVENLPPSFRTVFRPWSSHQKVEAGYIPQYDFDSIDKDELLIGYKVFGPHLDSFEFGSKRYYHFDTEYYCNPYKFDASYGFRFYTNINDCKDECSKLPISRICKVYVYGDIIANGNTFLTDVIALDCEVKNPFKNNYRRTKTPEKITNSNILNI